MPTFEYIARVRANDGDHSSEGAYFSSSEAAVADAVVVPPLPSVRRTSINNWADPLALHDPRRLVVVVVGPQYASPAEMVDSAGERR